MNLKTIRTWVRRVWVTLGISATCFMAWSVQEHGAPAAVFQSDPQVTVRDTSYGRLFTPVAATPETPAVVFLPGGLIDPDAYVPLVRSLASAGIPSAIAELPYRSAPTSGTRAELWGRIDAAGRDLAVSGGTSSRPVFLAGHSRGAMFAALYAADHVDEIDGLILIGSTHPRERSLAHATWPVLKILGSEDCVATVGAARENAGLLPAHTQWLELAGANHRQFGYYGWQIGDCEPAISRESQHVQTTGAILDFLKQDVRRAGAQP